MPESKRDAFTRALGRLRQRVVWKWEGSLPGARGEVQPANILTSSWLPQQDLLGHPNVRLFVTHGGAGSVQETICHPTPVVGIPLSNDQVSWHGTAREYLGNIVYRDRPWPCQ